MKEKYLGRDKEFLGLVERWGLLLGECVLWERVCAERRKGEGQEGLRRFDAKKRPLMCYK